MAPWRTTARSSKLSAPATIPATTALTLAEARAPADPGTLTCSSTRAPSPARSASAITGTNPAVDTRFGSSKRADFTWQTLTYRMPFGSERWNSRQVPSSQVRRAFAYQTHATTPPRQRIGAERAAPDDRRPQPRFTGVRSRCSSLGLFRVPGRQARA